MRLFRNRRLSAATLLLGAVFGAIASTQTWASFRLDSSQSAITVLDVSGVDLQPLAFALFLASGAGVFAVLLVSGWLRVALLVLVALLGVAAALASGQVSASLTASASSQLSEVLGLSDLRSIELALTAASPSPWVYVSMAMGLSVCLVATLSVRPSLEWEKRDTRYTRSGMSAKPRALPGEGEKVAAESRQVGDRIEDWDALTDGTDPTS